MNFSRPIRNIYDDNNRNSSKFLFNLLSLLLLFHIKQYGVNYCCAIVHGRTHNVHLYWTQVNKICYMHLYIHLCTLESFICKNVALFSNSKIYDFPIFVAYFFSGEISSQSEIAWRVLNRQQTFRNISTSTRPERYCATAPTKAAIGNHGCSW